MSNCLSIAAAAASLFCSPADYAANVQMSASASAKAQAVQLQTEFELSAAKQRQLLERWKIMQDLQIKIFEIHSDAAVDRQRASKAAFEKWSRYIRE